MRRALAVRPSPAVIALAVAVLAFLAWGAWKAVPFLQSKPQEIFATPTSQPNAELAQIAVPGKGGRVCLDGIEYGPDAKYVYVTLRSQYPTGAIDVEASAPGYTARTRQPAGGPADGPLILKIAPARRAVAGGTLCVVNHGRHQLALFGVPPGRGSSATTTKVDGKDSKAQLSVSLLTSPSKSLGSRLGTIFDHAAAFRPVTGWEIWLLALLALVGAPLAIAFAVAAAAAEDERAPRD
ncbi:MAG: hypothetical protein QOK49_898 [Baekduia sp.]|nr:hypothetical protein [Baekduia sp.]